MKKILKKVSKLRLEKHFKAIPPEETVYCINHHNPEAAKCAEKFMDALRQTPPIPLETGNLPPLI